MASEKLMRCEIEREDGSAAGVRYVPLEVFGLWEHLMEARHGFRVRSRTASVWVEIEESTGLGGFHSPAERVTELCLFVFDPDDGMLRCNCRFVPTGELDSVREILLRHYRPGDEAAGPAPWLRERPGIWFRPRAETDAAGQAVAAH